MPDLTFATSEELQAELGRRYPAYILIFRFHPEGGRGEQQERLNCGAHTGAPSEVLGLLRWATLVLEEQAKSNCQFHLGTRPLDGPPR